MVGKGAEGQAGNRPAIYVIIGEEGAHQAGPMGKPVGPQCWAAKRVGSGSGAKLSRGQSGVKVQGSEITSGHLPNHPTSRDLYLGGFQLGQKMKLLEPNGVCLPKHFWSHFAPVVPFFEC